MRHLKLMKALQCVCVLMAVIVALVCTLRAQLHHASFSRRVHTLAPLFGAGLEDVTPKSARRARALWMKRQPQDYWICVADPWDSRNEEAVAIVELVCGSKEIQRLTRIAGGFRTTEAVMPARLVSEYLPINMLDAIIGLADDTVTFGDGDIRIRARFDEKFGFVREFHYAIRRGRWPHRYWESERHVKILGFKDLSEPRE